MISPETYKIVSDKFGLFYYMGTESISFLDSMSLILNNTTVINSLSSKKDKITFTIESVKSEISKEHVSISSSLVACVRALQEHILTQYDSVDDFLSDNSIKVSIYFASLSDACGFSIAVENIEDSSS